MRRTPSRKKRPSRPETNDPDALAAFIEAEASYLADRRAADFAMIHDSGGF